VQSPQSEWCTGVYHVAATVFPSRRAFHWRTAVPRPFRIVPSSRVFSGVEASDRTAAYPVVSPVGPPEIVATLYHALGRKPETVMQDTLLGRPMTLCDGQPTRQLF